MDIGTDKMDSERKYDFLVVGSGLFGSTFACLAKKAGKRCLVIDRRPHTGGNVYCEEIAGINVHKYGAHIFHTNDRKVWDFVNSIVPFNRYTNCPVAIYNGELYNLPFNMNTFHQMWGVTTPREARAIIEEQRGAIEGEPRNLEEQAIKLVGRDIYRKLVKEYTEKQWGRDCRDLPAFIIKRLPVRFTYDNNYFNDAFQGIPIGGYNRLIEGLLDGVEVRTGVDFFEDREGLSAMADKIVYTGCIDQYFDYCFGKLSYRTVRFETETLDVPNYQGNAVVNYTSKSEPFTRIIEHKHFETFGPDIDRNPRTVISREYSSEWSEGMEPFYPVNDRANSELFQKYHELAEKETGVIFGGRLAEYKYYDMDTIVGKVMELFGEK